MRISWALHPVDVALQRVDLAVVGQHPERLRQPPLREGVGGIALVIDREGAFEPLVHQVGVEGRHLLGQHHALVDDRPARQRTQVHPLDARRRRRLLDPAADDVQLALELLLRRCPFRSGSGSARSRAASRWPCRPAPTHPPAHAASRRCNAPSAGLRSPRWSGSVPARRNPCAAGRPGPRRSACSRRAHAPCGAPGRRRTSPGSAHGCPRRRRSCHPHPPRPGARPPSAR